MMALDFQGTTINFKSFTEIRSALVAIVMSIAFLLKKLPGGRLSSLSL